MPEMSGVYAGGGVVRAHGAAGGVSSSATSITSGAANTKGSWVELIASTEFSYNWIEIDFTQLAGAVTAGYRVDIGIGSSTEQVIIPDLYVVPRGTNAGAPPYLFPVFIPKGSRLTARSSNLSASVGGMISIRLISGLALAGGSGSSWVSVYGFSGSSSTPTSVDPGATPDTDSAWTEIVASTDRDHRWLVISSRFGDGVIAASQAWRLSIGIGASTEQVLIGNLHSGVSTAADIVYNCVRCYPIFIPKGSRLSARSRCNVGTAADRDVFVALYGAG